jgi:hypothetical protein
MGKHLKEIIYEGAICLTTYTSLTWAEAKNQKVAGEINAKKEISLTKRCFEEFLVAMNTT